MASGRFPPAWSARCTTRTWSSSRCSRPTRTATATSTPRRPDARLNSEPVADLGRARSPSTTSPRPRNSASPPAADPENTLADALEGLRAAAAQPPRRSLDPTIASQIMVQGDVNGTAQGGPGAPPQPGAGRQGQRPHPGPGVRAAATTEPPTTWPSTSPALRTAPLRRSKPSPTSPRRRGTLSALPGPGLRPDRYAKGRPPRRLRELPQGPPRPRRSAPRRAEGNGREELLPPGSGRGHGEPRPPHWSERPTTAPFLTEQEWNDDPKKHGGGATEIKPAGGLPQARRRRRPQIRRGGPRRSRTMTELCGMENVNPVQLSTATGSTPWPIFCATRGRRPCW